VTIQLQRSEEFTDLLQKNLLAKHERNRRLDNTVHVSDILPTTCLRKSYYGRKFPESNPLTKEQVHHWVRGESSEHIITQLAGLGVSQSEIQMDGIVGHADIANSKIVIELKDTASFERFDFNSYIFRSYLRQLLYYLVMANVENGVLCIRYNVKELRWVKRDADGDHYLRPKGAKDVGIESWEVYLAQDDVVRGLLKNEAVRRKNLFLRALEDDDVSILPRLTGENKRIKCFHCPYQEKCFNQDAETAEAQELGQEVDLLDIGNVVDILDATPA
jgi:CRISPR/Cas system-associated exonuclease Cas4 (RecB family)